MAPFGFPSFLLRMLKAHWVCPLSGSDRLFSGNLLFFFPFLFLVVCGCTLFLMPDSSQTGQTDFGRVKRAPFFFFFLGTRQRCLSFWSLFIFSPCFNKFGGERVCQAPPATDDFVSVRLLFLFLIPFPPSSQVGPFPLIGLPVFTQPDSDFPSRIIPFSPGLCP